MQRHSATQTIRCEYVHSVLEEYLAGELNADAQAAIETHIATCQGCQNELDFALEVGEALQELPRPQPPAEVFDQVAAYVQSHPEPTPQRVVRFIEASPTWIVPSPGCSWNRSR